MGEINLKAIDYAFCCAEAGGDTRYCDCVNKNHAKALEAGRNALNHPSPLPAPQADVVGELRDAVREAITGDNSIREWCRLNECNPFHVSEFLAGKRGPPTDMLDALGYEVRYTRPTASAASDKDAVIAELNKRLAIAYGESLCLGEQNAALREALEEIDASVSHGRLGDWSIALSDIRKFAREALANRGEAGNG